MPLGRLHQDACFTAFAILRTAPPPGRRAPPPFPAPSLLTTATAAPAPCLPAGPRPVLGSARRQTGQPGRGWWYATTRICSASRTPAGGIPDLQHHLRLPPPYATATSARAGAGRARRTCRRKHAGHRGQHKRGAPGAGMRLRRPVLRTTFTLHTCSLLSSNAPSTVHDLPLGLVNGLGRFGLARCFFSSDGLRGDLPILDMTSSAALGHHGTDDLIFLHHTPCLANYFPSAGTATLIPGDSALDNPPSPGISYHTLDGAALRFPPYLARHACVAATAATAPRHTPAP